jgi:hypothetical protein
MERISPAGRFRVRNQALNPALLPTHTPLPASMLALDVVQGLLASDSLTARAAGA